MSRTRDLVTGGIATTYAAGFGIQKLVSPARNFNKAVGDLQSLDVSEKSINSLKKTALDFVSEYGGKADDFVRSSYDIQSSIANLKGDELGAITKQAAVFAQGTKASMGTATNYFGSMYGIFQKQADKMGKANFFQMLTGQSAMAVKMFKTDGNKLSTYFSSLSTDATAYGLSMQEQFAVGGLLGAAADGGRAATKYRGFLRGASGKGAKTLGLDFTGSDGKLLSTVEILEKIKAKFGDLDATEIGLLQTAFGDEGKGFVTDLIGKTDILRKNIHQIGGATSEMAEKMAKARTDSWDKLMGSVNALQNRFGTVLLPTVNYFSDILKKVALKMGIWTEKFPHLTKFIGIFIIGLFSAAAVAGIFAVLGGIATGALALWNLVVKGAIWQILKWIVVTTFQILKYALLTAAILTIVAVMGTALIIWGLFTAAQWALNAAFWANPITWIIASFIAIIATVIAVVYWWDEITNAIVRFANWITNAPAWAQAILAVFTPFLYLPSLIISNWGLIIEFFTKTLPNGISLGWNSTVNQILGFINKIIQTANLIPGVSIPLLAGNSNSQKSMVEPNKNLFSNSAAKPSVIGSNSVFNTQKTVQSKTVNVNVGKVVSENPNDFISKVEFAAG